MEQTQITCPESGSLENVELDRTPLGIVVTSCTRLCREGDVVCTRECTRRLDRREYGVVDDQERVLIVLGGRHAETARIADTLAECLARDRIIVERAVLGAGGSPPPLQDYQAVVIGAPMLLGRHAKAVADYIHAHESELAAIPTFLFAVGVSGLSSLAGYVGRMTKRTGWQPTASETFEADAMPRARIEELARRIADELPAAELQPSVA